MIVSVMNSPVLSEFGESVVRVVCGVWRGACERLGALICAVGWEASKRRDAQTSRAGIFGGCWGWCGCVREKAGDGANHDAARLGVDRRHKGRNDGDHSFAVSGLDHQEILCGGFLDLEDMSEEFIFCVVDGKAFELEEVVFAIFKGGELIAMNEDLGTSEGFGLFARVDAFQLQKEAICVFAEEADACLTKAFFAFAFEQKRLDFKEGIALWVVEMKVDGSIEAVSACDITEREQFFFDGLVCCEGGEIDFGCGRCGRCGFYCTVCLGYRGTQEREARRVGGSGPR